MAFDPRWQPPPHPHQPPHFNPNHRPPPYSNVSFPNPRSEATANISAAVAVAQQKFYYPQGAGASVANPEEYPIPEAAAAGAQQQVYYYQQGAVANAFSSTNLSSAGQCYYRGEPVLEIPSMASIPVPPPHIIIPPEWNDTNRFKGKSKKRIKKAKKVQPLHCDVCKIFCDTEEVLNSHKQGKQHKKNLQRLKDAFTPKPKEVQSTLNGSENNKTEKNEPEKNEPEKKEPEKNELEKKEPEKNEPEKMFESWKSKAQPVHCEVCDVYCNSVEFLEMHEAGKKHFKNVAKLKAAAEANGEGDEETKPDVIAQPPYCHTCNILCTGLEDLNVHYKGKNHKKKLKLQAFYNLIPAQVAMTDNEDSNQMKREAVENILTKKRKFVDCDGRQLRCDLCGIEVNSEIVYKSHVSGSKHAARVKKLQQLSFCYDLQQEGTVVADEEKTQH